MPAEFDEGKLAFTGPIIDRIKPIFEDLEFKTMLPRVMALLSGAAVPENTITSTSSGSQLSMFGGARQQPTKSK